MNIALIDKNALTDLMRYGELVLPEYATITLGSDMSVEQAIIYILDKCNPIASPSNYILVSYSPCECERKLKIEEINSLRATTDDGLHIFSTQFRADLIIGPAIYANIFQNYTEKILYKRSIEQGVKAFRSMCGLNPSGYDANVIETIMAGLDNRVKYRHHYSLPAEHRQDPYLLMISYERYAPYPNDWIGYFCDVIETLCYFDKPELGYTDAIAEHTQIYNKIISHGQGLTSKEIVALIQNETFATKANEKFYLQGGYLVPYIFYILRDRYRAEESFGKYADLIGRIRSTFPEAFDIAATFVGGFFGYKAFYEDYYTSLDLPILRKQDSSADASDKGETNLEESSEAKHIITDNGQATFDFSSSLYDKLREAIWHSSLNGNGKPSKLGKDMLRIVEIYKENLDDLKCIYDLFSSNEIVGVQHKKKFKVIFKELNYRKDLIEKITNYIIEHS